MSKFICLQAGHDGRTSGATGAPGEIELNVRIRNRLSQLLIERGFMVQLVGADPTKEEYNKDFDLFLALHGDANIYGTGGGVVACIAPPPFDSSEVSNAESRRIRDTINSIYFKETGIVNHPERSNKNMTEYYMWEKLTAKTPCVIIEMGVVQDAHDKVLLGNTELIASAIARALCSAFNVSYEINQPAPSPVPNYQEELRLANIRVEELNNALNAEKAESKAELEFKDVEIVKLKLIIQNIKNLVL
jgi:N-acetylmuramoyl-L-alanine amidase